MKIPKMTVLLPTLCVLVCLAAAIATVLHHSQPEKTPLVTKQDGGYNVRDHFVVNLALSGNHLLSAYVYRDKTLIRAEPFQTREYELPIRFGTENMTIPLRFSGVKHEDLVLYESVYTRYGGFDIYPTMYKDKLILQHNADSYRTTLLDLSTGEVRNLFGDPNRTGMDQELLERSQVYWCKIVATDDEGRYFFYLTDRNFFLKKGDRCQVYLYDVKEDAETLVFSGESVFFMDWAERDLPVFSITKNPGDTDSVLVGYDLSNHITVNLVDSEILGVRPYMCRNGFFVLKQDGRAVVYNYLTGEKIKTSLKLQYDSLNGHLFITCDKKYAILTYLVEKEPGIMYVTEVLIVNLHTKKERTFDAAEYGKTNVYQCCLLSDTELLINFVDHERGGLTSLILDLDSLF